MSAHLSEEEQIEALKNWWKDNGGKTIAAVVLGVGAWWGMGQWSDHQQAEQETNALVYQEMQKIAAADTLSDEQRTELSDRANSLKQQAAGTQYSRYASLMLARLAVERGDFDLAASELQLVLDGDGDQSLKNIAQLRLARVEAARGNLDQALSLLQSDKVGDMVSAYAELRGDLYLQKGDTEAARAAYQEAVDTATAADSAARPLLDLKLNRVTPAELAAEQAGPESAQQ